MKQKECQVIVYENSYFTGIFIPSSGKKDLFWKHLSQKWESWEPKGLG